MKKSPRPPQKPLTMAYAIKSFLGYLEGTEKAAHTVKSYRLDLLSFQRFLEKASGSRAIPLEALGHAELEQYHSSMREAGLKANTRRRKLMTIRKFLSYLAGRKKIPIDLGRSVLTPLKIERIPFTVSLPELLMAIQKLPRETIIDLRNRCLLWLLAETGCLVSEATKLRFDEVAGTSVRILGKSARAIPISKELASALDELKQRAASGKRAGPGHVFPGYNKFGSLGAPITSRGVELLVKHHAPQLGFPQLTPRNFRQSAVVHWFCQGLTREQIRERLGLKTDYAFKSFEPLFKSAKPI